MELPTLSPPSHPPASGNADFIRRMAQESYGTCFCKSSAETSSPEAALQRFRHGSRNWSALIYQNALAGGDAREDAEKVVLQAMLSGIEDWLPPGIFPDDAHIASVVAAATGNGQARPAPIASGVANDLAINWRPVEDLLLALFDSHQSLGTARAL